MKESAKIKKDSLHIVVQFNTQPNIYINKEVPYINVQNGKIIGRKI